MGNNSSQARKKEIDSRQNSHRIPPHPSSSQPSQSPPKDMTVKLIKNGKSIWPGGENGPLQWIFDNKYFSETYTYAFSSDDTRLSSYPSSLLAYFAFYFPELCESIPTMLRSAIYKDCTEFSSKDAQETQLISEIKDLNSITSLFSEYLKAERQLNLETITHFRNLPTFRNPLLQVQEIEFTSSKVIELIGVILQSIQSPTLAIIMMGLFSDQFKAALLSSEGAAFVPPESTKPLSTYALNFKLHSHGICSNGSFVFVLTDDNQIFMYRQKCGKIIPSSTSFDISFLNPRKDTLLFCTQSDIFFTIGEKVYRAPIAYLLANRLVYTLAGEFPNLINCTSNGVTYQLVTCQKKDDDEDKSAFLFDAVTNEKILEGTALYIDPEDIYISNGRYLSIYLPSMNAFFVTSLYHPSKLVFSLNFPYKITNMTLDCVSEVYFIAHETENQTIIESYSYNGPADPNLFGISLIPVSEGPLMIKAKNSIVERMTHLLFSNVYPISCLFKRTKKDVGNVIEMIKDLQSSEMPSFIYVLLILLFINISHPEFVVTPEIRELLVTLLTPTDKGSENSQKIVIGGMFKYADKFFLPYSKDNEELFLRILNINMPHIFYEWCLNQLAKTQFISLIPIEKNSIIDKMLKDSFKTEELSRFVHYQFLLIHQQALIRNTFNVYKDKRNKKTNVNLNQHPIFINLGKYFQILVDHFMNLLEADKSRNYSTVKDSVCFQLIQNFMRLLLPIVHIREIATIIIKEFQRLLVALPNNNMIQELKHLIFMIYTFCAAATISGPEISEDEKKFQPFFKGSSVKKGKFEFKIEKSSDKIVDFLNNQELRNFINDGKTQMNSIYNSIKKYKTNSPLDQKIDRLFLVCAGLQLNIIDQILNIHTIKPLPNHLKIVLDQMCVFRRKFHHDHQNETNDNKNETNQQNNDENPAASLKTTEKYIANIGLLLQFNNSFPKYVESSKSEQTSICKKLLQFIQENNPFSFNPIHKDQALQVNLILEGFASLNQQIANNADPFFIKCILSGLSSAISSFEPLNMILSSCELSPNQKDILNQFFSSIINLVICDQPKYEYLEICYSILSSCPSLTESAYLFINQLLKIIISSSGKVQNIIINTACGLLQLESGFPDQLPITKDNTNLTLFYSCLTKNECTQDQMETIFNFITQDQSLIKSTVVAHTFVKCFQSSLLTTEYKCDILNKFYNILKDYLKSQNLTPFTQYLYYLSFFREILNERSELSRYLLSIILETKPDQKNEVYLLFSILANSIEGFNQEYIIKLSSNQKSFLKYQYAQKVSKLIQTPINPFSNSMNFDYSIDFYSVPPNVLAIDSAPNFDFILQFANNLLTMTDPISIIEIQYLQTLYMYLNKKENILKIPDEIIHLFLNASKPYLSYPQLSATVEHMYSSQLNIRPLKPLHGFNLFKHGDLTCAFLPEIFDFNQNIESYNINAFANSFYYIQIGNNMLIDVKRSVIIPSLAEFPNHDVTFLEITVYPAQRKLTINGKEIEVNPIPGSQSNSGTFLLFITPKHAELQIQVEPETLFTNEEYLKFWEKSFSLNTFKPSEIDSEIGQNSEISQNSDISQNSEVGQTFQRTYTDILTL